MSFSLHPGTGQRGTRARGTSVQAATWRASDSSASCPGSTLTDWGREGVEGCGSTAGSRHDGAPRDKRSQLTSPHLLHTNAVTFRLAWGLGQSWWPYSLQARSGGDHISSQRGRNAGHSVRLAAFISLQCSPMLRAEEALAAVALEWQEIVALAREAVLAHRVHKVHVLRVHHV